MFIENIDKKYLEFRKSNNSVGKKCLSTLLNDINMIGKNSVPPRQTTEEEAVRVVKKHLDIVTQNLETLSNFQNKTDKINQGISDTKEEITILTALLPSQLTKEELSNVIQNILTDLLANNPKSPKLIGLIMKNLRDNYLGRFDGNQANEIIKTALAN